MPNADCRMLKWVESTKYVQHATRRDGQPPLCALAALRDIFFFSRKACLPQAGRKDAKPQRKGSCFLFLISCFLALASCFLALSKKGQYLSIPLF